MIDPNASPVAYHDTLGLSWVTTEELRWLKNHLPDRGLFVEIGTASGATAAKIADAKPGLSILCVDHFPDHDAPHVTSGDPCRVDTWRRNRRPRMSLWLGTLWDLYQTCPFVNADAVLVDAGHSEPDITSDLVDAVSLLRHEGTLLVHDYDDPTWPDVKVAVDKLAAGSFRLVDIVGSIAVLKRRTR